MNLRRRAVGTLLVLATIAAMSVAGPASAGTGLRTAAESANSAPHFHCSKWVRVKRGVDLEVRSCVELVHRGRSALVRGKFLVRNRTAKAKGVSYFPQAESRRQGSVVTTQMGGSSPKERIAAHRTVTFRRHVLTLTGSRMWISVEYLLYLRKTAVRFRDTPHVKPYWR